MPRKNKNTHQEIGSVIRQKGRISRQRSKENRAYQIFRKTKISCPLRFAFLRYNRRYMKYVNVAATIKSFTFDYLRKEKLQNVFHKSKKPTWQSTVFHIAENPAIIKISKTVLINYPS